MKLSRRMVKLRAAATRVYTSNPHNARVFRDGFAAGWAARELVAVEMEIAEIDRDRRDAGLADLGQLEKRHAKARRP